MLDGTYTGLKASVADWLNRADLTAIVPDFITLAEAQISRRLLEAGPVRRMMTKTAVTYSTEFGSLPTDFMGVRSLYLTGTQTLQIQKADPEQITYRKSITTDLTGDPDCFAIVGSQIQLFPSPSSALTGELVYWQAIPALSVSNASNWVLTYHPDAYLFGSLLQAAPYLQDDSRVPVWESAFGTILNDIVEADKIERDAPYLSIQTVLACP